MLDESVGLVTQARLIVAEFLTALRIEVLASPAVFRTAQAAFEPLQDGAFEEALQAQMADELRALRTDVDRLVLLGLVLTSGIV